MNSSRVAVFIATTAGPVRIVDINREAPELGRSVACVAGSTNLAGINSAYAAFAEHRSEFCSRLFANRPYRLDIASNIDVGSSWRLPVCIAHALHNNGRFADAETEYDAAVIASGELAPETGAVSPVAHLEEKMTELLRAHETGGFLAKTLSLALPMGSAQQVAENCRERLQERKVEILEIERFGDLDDLVGAVDPEPRAYRPLRTPVVALAIGVAAISLGAIASKCNSVSKTVPGAAFKDCIECPEVIPLPSGVFMMGSKDQDNFHNSLHLEVDDPARTVTIAKPFAIGRFEVTVSEFTAFVDATGYKLGDSCLTRDFEKMGFEQRTKRSVTNFLTPGYATTGKHPVTCVSWQDARSYADWLSTRTGIRYRLPTDGEWEYAARAGATTRYTFGEAPDDVCRHARFADLSTAFPYASTCASGITETGPVAVGSFPPNAWGLHDVHGNVAEYVEGCSQPKWETDTTTGDLIKSSDTCAQPIARGGGWGGVPAALRLARRIKVSGPNRRTDTFGFRIARDLASDDPRLSKKK